MSASASFQIDPGTGVYGTANTAADAAALATVNCRLVSTSGVSSIEWRIFGTHGVAAPAITLSGNPTGQIASFDMAAGTGQAYGIECKVNGGAGITGDSSTTQTSAVYVLDTTGYRRFFIGETYERNSTYGVVLQLNYLMDDIEAFYTWFVTGGITIIQNGHLYGQDGASHTVSMLWMDATTDNIYLGGNDANIEGVNVSVPTGKKASILVAGTAELEVTDDLLTVKGNLQLDAAKSIDAYTNSGYLKSRRVSQSVAGPGWPTPEVGELLQFHNTDDGKTYLMINDATVGVRKVELT